MVHEILDSGNLSNGGGHEADDRIRSALDREYPEWKKPTKTYMVPRSFPGKHCGNKGLIAEDAVYNLLQQLGEQNNEPMFVVYSVDFCEHIPGIGRKRSWVMGEHDFVIIHKRHGPIFFQVKATKDGKTPKEVEDQLRKDKLVLQKFFEELVNKRVTGKKTTELFKNFPAFAVMPNCKRGSESVCRKENFLYQEDCSSLEAFADWWQKRIASAEHPAVPQAVFEYLVMKFVGMSHLRPHLGLSIDSTDQRLIYKTKQQMDIHAGSFPPKLWIRGPAGSGKAYLILKKASRLAIDIVKKTKGHVNEKILIVCPNSLWCKDLQKKLHALIAKETKENVTGVLEIITFAELVSQLNEGNRPNFEHDKEYAVNQALECLPKNGYWGYYDHIFVYDGEDLFGKNWPLLLEKMHKGSVQSEPAGLQQTGFFWVMYDTNQFLYSAEDRHFSCLRNSALLDKVFRTKNILTQLKKYFKPMMPHDSITLGHQEAGPPIEWDDSLVRGIKEIDAAPLVVEWLTKLHSDGCQARATCILVETKVKQIHLQYALDALETESQSGKSLVETSTNAVVVESVRQFKGMRSKVVILYNPPFEDDPYSDTKGFLYTAISSCTCRLIVISTKEGVAALKSTVGVQENSCGLGNKVVMESPGHQLSLDGDVGYDYAKE